MKGNGPSSKQILVYNFHCLKDLGNLKGYFWYDTSCDTSTYDTSVQRMRTSV